MLNTLLWIVQGLLALVFLIAGLLLLLRSKAQLALAMGWVEGFPQGIIKLIGALLVLGALGLFLPALAGIYPWLTPLAGAGLALIMLGASITHLRRRSNSSLALTVVLLLLCILVAYGRFVLAPL